MDCAKVGALIARLRHEKGCTQREVAEHLGVSGKAVSKWERGQGCPDVTLLRDLAAFLGAEPGALLRGELEEKDKDAGNMKKMRFYVCPTCGNVLTSAGPAEVSCCGRTLQPLEAQPAAGEHCLSMQALDDEWYITFAHPMEKAHYLRFLAWVRDYCFLLVRLYPEQGGEARLPQLRGGRLVFCCSAHGLFEQKL